MTEPDVTPSGAVSETARPATAAGLRRTRTRLAHGPETVPAAPLQAVPLPDPPDLDVDAAVREQRRAGTNYETPPANGEYRGSVEVRRIPRGVSGEELVAEKSSRLAVGARWQRGTQLVEITKVRAGWIQFREIIDHYGRPSARPDKIHNIGHHHFLNTGRPA